MKNHVLSGFSIVEVLVVTLIIGGVAFFIASSISQGKKEEARLETRMWSLSGLDSLSNDLNKWFQTRKALGFYYDAKTAQVTQLTNLGDDLVHEITFSCDPIPQLVTNYLNSINPGLVNALPMSLAASLTTVCPNKVASNFSCPTDKRPVVSYTEKIGGTIQKTKSYPTLSSNSSDMLTKFKTEGIAAGICTSPLDPSDAGKAEELFVSMQVVYLQGKEFQILRKDRVYPLFDNSNNGLDKNPNVLFYASP